MQLLSSFCWRLLKTVNIMYFHIFSDDFCSPKFLHHQSELWSKTWKKYRTLFGNELLLVLLGIRPSLLLDTVYPDLRSFQNLISSLRQVLLHLLNIFQDLNDLHSLISTAYFIWSRYTK